MLRRPVQPLVGPAVRPLISSAPAPTVMQRAIALLRRKASSPAGIFTAGSGYLQTPANLLTYSGGIGGTGWSVISGAFVPNAAVSPDGSTTSSTSTPSASAARTDAAAVAVPNDATTRTFAVIIKPSGTATIFLIEYGYYGGTVVSDTVGVYGTGAGYNTSAAKTVTDIGGGFYLIVGQLANNSTGNTQIFFRCRSSGGSDTATWYRAGLFSGSYTASQLLSMGGIPWTMGTASVALSLGSELIGAWDSVANSSVSNGVVTTTGTGAFGYAAKQTISVTLGYTYLITITTAKTSGTNLAMNIGAQSIATAMAGSQTYQAIITATVNGSQLFSIYEGSGGAWAGSISAISFKQVLSTACPVYTDAHVYLPGATQTSYGPELVTNGDFSSASGWTVGAGITVSGGVANISAGAGYIEQGIPTVAGVTYTVTAIATGNATYCGAWASSGQSTALSGSPGGRAAGVVTFTFTAGGATSYIGFTATGGGALTLDSVSTRVVTTSSAVISGLTAGNYLLSDGSSGYSQVDGLQGLCLDAMGAVGAELVTNGSFATDTNWTKGGGFTITGGSLVGTAVANFVGCTQTITLVAGGRYFIEYDLVVTSGSLRAYFSGGSNALGVEYTTSGHKSEYVVAVTGNTTLVLSSQAIGFTGTVDNISVREVTGIHATSTARPTLRRGLTNLLTYSNDATNAIWAVSGTATKPSASTINIPTVSDWVYQQITTVSGAAMTLGVVLSGTGTVKIGTNSGGLTTTSITLTSTPTLYVHNLTVGAVTTYCIAAFHDTGNTATSVTFGGAGLFSGTLTASQIISEGSIPLTTTAAASNPSAGRYSSQFAGAQSLLIGNLGITNAATIVIAGVLNSLASIQVMFGEAANGVQIYVPPNGTIVFDKNGSGGLVTSGLAQIVAGTPFVITARLLGGTAVIRKNGVQIATASSALVFAATTGARIGTAFDGVSFQCTGSLGMVIPLPVALTDAECLTVERLVASNFPNAPVF